VPLWKSKDADNKPGLQFYMNSKKPQILIADDEETIRVLLEYNLKRAGYQTFTAADGKEAIDCSHDELSCALIDLKMPAFDGLEVLKHFKKELPDVPVIIMSALGQVKDAVAAMKQGAFEYLTKPFDLDELLALTSSACKYGEALKENITLRESASPPNTSEDDFLGESHFAKNIKEIVETVAPLDSTVLITGESGVGKGLLARMIHRASRRHAKPFITTSCPTLPRELLESEMFGHERGAFTGAHQRRIGRLEMAEGGTLFLDEIGELPLLLQPKLLNVLQDKQYQRVGGASTISTDVRVIAATNADLKEKSANKEFREDLYYRLNVMSIRIPPLRDRAVDIPIIAARILQRLSEARKTETINISPEVLSLFQKYKWPGNVRELENILERASAFCKNDTITVAELPEDFSISIPVTQGNPKNEPVKTSLGGMLLEDLEKIAIQETLALYKGNKAASARSLGITEKSIYNKMSRLGLNLTDPLK
jgi:DNA-binding NtrC family response regulator